MFKYFLLIILVFTPYLFNNYFFTGYSFIIIGFYSLIRGVNIRPFVLISYLALLSLAGLQYLIHGLEYIGFVKVIFFLPFIYFTANFIVTKYYSEDTGTKLVKDLVIVTFINSLLSYGALLSPDFADSFYRIVYVNPKLFDYPIFRPSGLFYDGYSYASSFNTLVAIIALNFIVERLETHKLFLFGSMLFVILANNLFLGRFGIVIFMLYLPIYIFRKFKAVIISFFSLKMILISVLFAYGVSLILSTKVGNYLEWALSFMDVLSSTQSNSTTSELLTNHYGIHLVGYELLIGNPYLINGLSIDPGIFRIINFGGLILFIAFTVFFLSCLHSIYYLQPKYRHVLITILGFLVIANFKDVYIISPYSISFVYSLLVIILKKKSCPI